MGKSPQCIGIIGDLIRSRGYVGEERSQLQEQLQQLLIEINEEYKDEIVAKFVVTIGDEYQGLLKTAEVIPDILFIAEQRMYPVKIRHGFGLGRLDTELREDAIAMDGSVWHNARTALETARKKRISGGVFRGFGTGEDIVLSGVANMLRLIRDRLTKKQREVVAELRKNRSHQSIAEMMAVSRQSITKQAGAAGWDSYEQGEIALKILLSAYDFRPGWSK